ncbi:MAG: dynamin family protein [Candidatus Zipacnadales bacterium]
MKSLAYEVIEKPSPEALPQAINALAAFCTRRGHHANAARVAEIGDRLAAGTFNLVVFGEFKRGKTTLINALIGDDLLPMAIVPLTSVVTVLRYATEETIEVEFLDGRKKDIKRETLADYVTEKGNPENRKGVKLVRIGIPSDLLRNGIQLVDTPGVGSVYEHNTEAARSFLPHVDGAILLVASDPPISRGECEFLREIQPHVARLFVVQNKIDHLRPDELKESLEFTYNVLQTVLPTDGFTVFPLSAREALEAKLRDDMEHAEASGLLAFEEELRRFQIQEQTKALSRSIVGNALRVAEDERLGLDLERQALRMRVEELEARYTHFCDQRAELLRQREDDITLIRAEARKLIRQVLAQDYEKERITRAPILREMVETWAELQGNVSPRELLKRGNLFIRQTLFEVLGNWRKAEAARLLQELGSTLSRFTEQANETLSAIYEAAREIFELPPRSVKTVGYFAAPSRFLWLDWNWEPRPGLTTTILLHLLPDGRRRAAKIIADKLVEEHDLACGRLRHDFSQRAQAAFNDYLASVNHSLKEASSAIDCVISRTLEQRQRTHEATAETESRLAAEGAELATIIDKLRGSLPAEPNPEA